MVNLLNRVNSYKELKATLGGCVIEKAHNNLVIYKEKL